MPRLQLFEECSDCIKLLPHFLIGLVFESRCFRCKDNIEL